MDMARVVEVLQRVHATRRVSGVAFPWEVRSPDAEPVAEAGLWCARCGGEVRHVHRAREQVAYGSDSPLVDDYLCADPDCGAVRAPWRVIQRELQAFTVRRWSQPKFVASWRRARLGELDAEIAELLAVHAFAADPRRRWKVNYQLGGRRVPRLSGGGDWKVQSGLSALASYTVERVGEREGLKVALGHRAAAGATASVGGLPGVCADYGLLVLALEYPSLYPAVRAQVGNRKQQRAARDDVQRRLWEMLAETEWREASHPGSPAEDAALREDWGTSRGAWGRKRALLDLAADGYRLELEPAHDAGVRLRVVKAG